MHFRNACAILQYSTFDGGIDMLNILGLEKHKTLYDALTDFDNMIAHTDTLTELQIRDLSMRLRYALEHILQHYARVRGITWTTPFEVINTLRKDHVITWEDANALHAARRIANEEGAHLNEEKSPMELIEDAFRGLVDFVPKFLADVPEPSTLPLLRAVKQGEAVEAAKDEPVEQREHFPLVKVKCGSIPLLKVDASHNMFDAIPGFGGITCSRRKTLLAGKSDIPPYNLNLVEWLYRNPDEEHRYIYTIPQGTFVRRGLLAEDYLNRVNTLIQQFNQKGTIGEPVYIPGLVQQYFGFSQVYFEGEELKFAPVEPAVILRDHALFCETVELPDCVTHIPNNDLLKQVNEFTLNPQVKGSVFSCVKHLILPNAKWGDRVFLRYFTNLESVKIKEVGEIEPMPATGAPEVFPALVVPRDQQHRYRMYGELKQNPKFISFMDAVNFEQATVTVHKRGVDTVTLPQWAYVGQKRFGFLAEVVYHAGCLVKGVDTRYVRVGPASSLGGFRYPNNPEQKQALVEALIVDPDFIDFVQTEADETSVIQIRDGHRFHIIPDWAHRGANYMNAYLDAVYEAGCRLKGWDPTPKEIVIERRVKTKPTGNTAMQTPAGQRIAKARAKPPKSFITREDGFRTFDCPEGKEALVQALMADPQFVAFAKVNRARPKRKLFESPYPWYQQGAQKFRAHIDAVYEAGLRIRGFSKDPQPQEPAPQEPPKPVKKAAPAPKKKEPAVFRNYENSGGKEGLIEYLMKDPEFVEFINSNPIKTRKEVWNEPDPWYKRASEKFRAEEDAVYEAGLRIKGIEKPEDDVVMIGSFPVTQADIDRLFSTDVF